MKNPHENLSKRGVLEVLKLTHKLQLMGVWLRPTRTRTTNPQPKSTIREHTKNLIVAHRRCLPIVVLYCQTPGLGIRLGVDFDLPQSQEEETPT